MISHSSRASTTNVVFIYIFASFEFTAIMFNVIILFTLFAVACFTTAISDDKWMFTFNSTSVELEMGSSLNISFQTYTNASWSDEELKIQVLSSDEEVAQPNNGFLDLPRYNNHSAIFPLSFNLTASFLGYTKLYFRVVEISELNVLLTICVVIPNLNKNVQIITFQKMILWYQLNTLKNMKLI